MSGVEIVSAAGVAGLLAAACTFTGTHKNPFSETEIKFEVDPGENEAELPAAPPALPEGACVKVTFMDGSGNPMGSLETTAGSGPFPFPEGAEGAEVGPCDEDDGKDPKDKVQTSGGSSSGGLGSGERRSRYDFWYIPLDPLDGEAVFVSYGVQAASLNEARLVSRQFSRRLFSAPAPRGLDTRTAHESILLPDGSVQLTLFSESAPQSLEVSWNAQFVADLSGAVVEHRNGWFRTFIVVPAALVEKSMTGTSSNTLSYSLVADGIDFGGESSVLVNPF
jgi:hypothetical protein